MQPAPTHYAGNLSQFSLLGLFEYVTLCCILAALASFLGIAASLCLMAFTLAIFLRRGWLAVAMLAAAFMGTMNASATAGFFRETAVSLIAGLICLWYMYRRQASRPSPSTHDRNLLRPWGAALHES